MAGACEAGVADADDAAQVGAGGGDGRHFAAVAHDANALDVERNARAGRKIVGLADGESRRLPVGGARLDHGLCAEACPVGAITMVLASPSMAADMPRLTPEYETSVGSLFIVGELGGLALIKNAVNQGRDCVDTIAGRLSADGTRQVSPDVFDVLIVGAGPAGISASLRAIQRKLNYITLERDEIGGTVAKY